MRGIQRRTRVEGKEPMTYRQCTVPDGHCYIHGPIDPAIQPLVTLCLKKGLATTASCAGTGPAPSTQRKRHDLWRDQPYLSFGPQGSLTPPIALVRVVKARQVVLPGGVELVMMHVYSNGGGHTHTNDEATCRCWNGWAGVHVLHVGMFGEATGDLTSLFPALKAAGFIGLDAWLLKMRRLWLKVVAEAIGSLPAAQPSPGTPAWVAPEMPAELVRERLASLADGVAIAGNK